MRISSKFHDYYDAALKDFESDPQPFYTRTQELLNTKPLFATTKLHIHRSYHCGNYQKYMGGTPATMELVPPSNFGSYDSNSTRYKYNELKDVNLCILGFCGKLYPMYSTYGKPINGHYIYPDQKAVTYHYELMKDEFAIYKDNKISIKTDLELINTFDELTNCKALKALFLKHNVPIFLYICEHKSRYSVLMNDNINLILNPHIGDLDFQKIMNPWSAMQELSMFLGNDLVKDQQPPMPVGSDKIIAESKGFDKWSFRKMKEPK